MILFVHSDKMTVSHFDKYKTSAGYISQAAGQWQAVVSLETNECLN